MDENLAISCFLFPEWRDKLTGAQAKEYDFYKARLESRLNVPYGLLEAVAKLLGQLINPYAFSFMIPNPVNIDSESLRVIENYCRFFPGAAQEIVVGFPTDIVDREDAIGITWERSQGTVQYFAGNLLRYPGTALVRLESGPVVAQGEEQPFWYSNHAEDPETLIFEGLTGFAGDTVTVTAAIQAMESSYERYSFRAVIKTGLKILERGCP